MVVLRKDKEGNIKRSFRAPKDDDWTLIKKKTEADIDKIKMTVGAYIYDTLLQKPDQKNTWEASTYLSNVNTIKTTLSNTKDPK